MSLLKPEDTQSMVTIGLSSVPFAAIAYLVVVKQFSEKGNLLTSA